MLYKIYTRIIEREDFMNKKLLVSVLLCFFIFSLVLLCQEESKDKKIWGDDQIGITLDKLQKANVLSPEVIEMFRFQPGDVPTPSEGYDFVSMFITISRIENVHVVSLGGRGEESAILSDTKGNKYDMSFWNVKGIEYLDPSSFSSPSEFIEGAIALLVFEIPKKEKPAKLTFLYYFKKTWEEESKKTGQIDINLSHIQ